MFAGAGRGVLAAPVVGGLFSELPCNGGGAVTAGLVVCPAPAEALGTVAGAAVVVGFAAAFETAGAVLADVVKGNGAGAAAVTVPEDALSRFEPNNFHALNPIAIKMATQAPPHNAIFRETEGCASGLGSVRGRASIVVPAARLAKGSIAAATSAGVAKRSDGFFASIFFSAAPSPAGTSGRNFRTSWGARVACWTSRAATA